MDESSRTFQPSSSNRKFQAIFASLNRYFTENSRWVPIAKILCCFYAVLVSSKCRVSVELGRGKSLICIRVESMTSPQGKSAFLQISKVPSQCLASQVKMRSSILIKCLSPYINEVDSRFFSFGRTQQKQQACPVSNLSPVFGPSITRKQERSPSNARNSFLYLIQR